MCARSLLDSEWGNVTVSLGQLAHNVGATTGPSSPRGDSAIPMQDRNREENLLLLCPDCHRKVDAPENSGIYTIEVLCEIKKQHEDMVAAATDFATQHRTLVVLTNATVRGSAALASHRQIAQALAAARRAPYSVDGRQVRVEIDLSDNETDEWVWERGKQRINEAVAKVRADTDSGHVDHVSLFALAPIPLLVYLGHVLDDKIEVDIYRRARGNSDRVWCWQEDSTEPPLFKLSFKRANTTSVEAVVLVSVSGTVSQTRIPDTLKDLPLICLHPDKATPKLDLLDTPAAIDSFARTWRDLFGHIEQDLPRAKRLHVLAAVPVPAAVAMGRYRSRSANPNLLVYQRQVNDTYVPAVEISG